MTDAELDELWHRCARQERTDNWICADHGDFIELRRIRPHGLFQKHARDNLWKLVDGER